MSLDRDSESHRSWWNDLGKVRGLEARKIKPGENHAKKAKEEHSSKREYLTEDQTEKWVLDVVHGSPGLPWTNPCWWIVSIGILIALVQCRPFGSENIFLGTSVP